MTRRRLAIAARAVCLGLAATCASGFAQPVAPPAEAAAAFAAPPAAAASAAPPATAASEAPPTVAASTAGPAAAATPVHAIAVVPGVWMVQGAAALGSPANRNFISNAGFFETDGGVVVVDALGSPVLARELLAEIHRVTKQPLRYVILTHYHADHIYGLQVLKEAGATVLAHAEAREYVWSETAQKRLEASRQDLAPWIDAQTRIVPADRWIDAPQTVLKVGSYDVVLRHVGPAHTPEDMVVFVPRLGAMFSGDLFFRGRIPYVGQADSGLWIASLDRLMADRPKVVIPGHGPVSTDPLADMQLTRDYLTDLRRAMGDAARNLEPFEDAYAKADWSRYAKMPLFDAANRMNAYNTYLLMEQQAGR